MNSLYQKLKKAKCKLSSYVSDLYVELTPTSKDIIEKHFDKKINKTVSAMTFKSQIDNKIWVDCPFQHEPYYKELDERIAKRKGG